VKALARVHRWIWEFRYQPLTVRLLAGVAGILTAAAAFAAPAEAAPIDDSFIGALNHAGVNYGEPGNAVSMGQSICPMLEQPGGNFAAAATRVRGNGMSPQMADMFTRIAISMYCPTMMADVADGNLSGLPQIPGLPGLPGIPGI
jgi:hypothetical protein